MRNYITAACCGKSSTSLPDVTPEGLNYSGHIRGVAPITYGKQLGLFGLWIISLSVYTIAKSNWVRPLRAHRA